MAANLTKTLMDGLFEEMNRVREIIKIYNEIPAGHFAGALMQEEIRLTEEAIKKGDIINIMYQYKQLKNFTL